VRTPSRPSIAEKIDAKWVLAFSSTVDGRIAQVRDAIRTGRPAAAVEALTVRLAAGEDSVTRILLGDALAAQGDWARAGLEYQRAVTLAPGDLVATLGLAHVLAEVGRVDESLGLLDRVDAEGGTAGFYRALVLLGRADEIRGSTRDGDPVITTKTQAVECSRIAEQVETATSDPALRDAAFRLRRDADAARTYAWRRRPALWAGIAAILALCLAAVVYGGLRSDPPILLVGVAVGAIAVGAGVTGGRQSGWQRRAEAAGPLLAHSGF
jgi:hypothetical protein